MEQEGSKKNNKIWEIGILSALLVFYAVLLLLLARRNTLWYDEAFGVVAIRHGIFDMFRLLALDVHPPLYYLFLKVLSIFGGQAWFAYRLASVIPVIVGLTILCIYLYKRVSFTCTAYFLMIMMATPCLLHFGVELRMYGLAFLFVSLTALAALELINRESIKGYIFLGIFAVASAYTHYFAGAAAMGICIADFVVLMILSEKRRELIPRWIACVAGMAFAYSPWLYIFVKQSITVKNEFWLQEYTLTIAKDTLLFFISDVNLGTIFLCCAIFAVAGITGVLLLVKAMKEKKNSEDLKKGLIILFLTFSSLFPIVLGLGVSALVRPVFQAKYAFPILGIWGMLLAVLLSANRKVWQKTAAYALIAVYLFISLIPTALKEWRVSSDGNVTAMLQMLDSEELEKLPFIHSNPQLMGCFAAYYPERIQYISNEVLEREYYPAWEELGNVHAIDDSQLEFYKRGNAEDKVLFVTTSYDDNTKLEEAEAKLIGKYKWSTYSGYDIYIYKI